MPSSTSNSNSNPTTPLEPPRKNRFLGGGSSSSSNGWTRSLSNLRKEAQNGSSGSGTGLGLGSGSTVSSGSGGQLGGKRRAMTTDDLGRASGGMRNEPTTTTTTTKSTSSAGTSRQPTPTQAPPPAKGLRAFFQSFKRSHSTPAAPSRSTVIGGKGVLPSSTSMAVTKTSVGGKSSVVPVEPSVVLSAAPVVPSPPTVDEQQTNLLQPHTLDQQPPIEPANIPLPPSPLLLNSTEINPFESTPENTLDRAPTTESIDTEPSLSNTDETIDVGLGMAGGRAGMDEAIVTPVTSLDGGSGSEGRLGVVGSGAEGGFDEKGEEEDEFDMADRARGLDVKKIGGEVVGSTSAAPDSEGLGSGDVTPTPASPSTFVTMGPTINATRPTIDTSSFTLSRTTSPVSSSQSKPNSIPIPIPTRGSYIRSSSAGSNGGQASRSPPVANSARYQQHPQGPLISPQMQYQQARPQPQPSQGGISPAGLVRGASNRFRQNSYGSQNKVRSL
jgi:hypothetical protein